jgi:oxygen-dependent protoporphyrinogen oxidase
VTGTVILGAGITGLAAAERLAAASAPFVLVEADTRLGGKITTERVDGFVIEGGPDCFLASKPGAIGLARELGLEPRLRGTNPVHRRTYVKRGGRLHQLPEGITGLVPSRLKPLLTTSILSPWGRLRAGLEALIPARRSAGEESIAQFVTRRFGRDAYDWLVEPLLSGIYAGDGARLSLDATFPMIGRLERDHGSILRGIMRGRRAGEAGPAPSGFMTPAGGLAELVEAIEGRLPAANVRCGVAAAAVERDAAGYRVSLEDGTTIVADHVILATPAFVSARLVDRLDPELARELREIPFVSTATVSLAFAASAITRQLQGYGYVSPRAEGGPVVACTVTSNKFPDRVPPGGVLIRFFIGRAGLEDVVEQPESVLVDIARAELAQVLGVTAVPAFTRVFRWHNSMPQYVVGHPARLARLEQLRSAHPGLQLAGASYRGVGIPDCISSGWVAASAVLGAAKVAA